MSKDLETGKNQVVSFLLPSDELAKVNDELWKKKIDNRSEGYREIFRMGFTQYKGEKSGKRKSD